MNALVIKRRDMTDEDVYIGRGSRWGNPYVFEGQTPKDPERQYLTLAGKRTCILTASREESIARYRKMLFAKVREEQVTLTDLAALAGKRLACYCAPEPCHGDVLVGAARWAAAQLDGEPVQAEQLALDTEDNVSSVDGVCPACGHDHGSEG